MKKSQFKTVFSRFFTLFILLGAVFVPAFKVQAGFFSDTLFGTKVSAATDTTLPSNNNLQTMALLQPTVSPVAVVDAKTKNAVKTDTDVNIVSDTALLPATSAMGTSSAEADISADQISVYVVKKGDVLTDIAKMFGISANTIVWANDLKKGASLTEGDVLLIPPVSGVVHVVSKGQTLKGIAKLYAVDVEDITSFNDIGDDGIAVGDELVIPGAEVKSTTQSKKVKQGGRLPAYKDKNQMRSTAGYFIKPIPCDITQGRHDGNAVDLSCHVSGTPIKAAASGRIIFARYGRNGGYGNLVIIAHPNGMQTYYAHQSKLNVSIGDDVSQGQIIGYVGSTGRSTGPHVHFEVRGGWNPGWDNSWAQ